LYFGGTLEAPVARLDTATPN